MNQQPHEVLGVAADAAAETVRRRYLQLVREFPPEQSPQEFARIRAAYETLRDPIRRAQETLFRVQTANPTHDIQHDLRDRVRSARLSVDQLFSLLDN